MKSARFRFFWQLLDLLFRFLNATARSRAPLGITRLYLVRTHAVGDVLLTTPVARVIKQAWPHTQITVVVGEKSRVAVDGNPYIDSVESFPEKWWFSKRFGKILRMTWRLRRKSKDAILLLHASPLIHLWGFLIKAPVRVGFDEEGRGFSLTHKVGRAKTDYDRYLGDVNLDLVRALGVPAENAVPDFFLRDDELRAARRFIPPTERTGRPYRIGTAPGGGQNAFEKTCAKHWPVDCYAELMIQLSKQRDIQFFLLGDSTDVQTDRVAEKLANRANVMNLKGKTTFRELAALIHHLDILITNDSSPLHLAVAMNKPVVALFGPTAHWALFPPGPHRIALQSTAPCSPCYTYGRFPGCPNPTCMAEISVQEVQHAVESILNSALLARQMKDFE